MAKESGIGYFFPEVAKFVDETYPVDLYLVGGFMEEAKTHVIKFKDIKYGTPSAWLYNEVWTVAEKEGVNNLPTMLAAVIELEEKIPAERKMLTPQKYLQLMRRGELTSSIISANTHNVADADLHIRRALILNDFLKIFE